MGGDPHSSQKVAKTGYFKQGGKCEYSDSVNTSGSKKEKKCRKVITLQTLAQTLQQAAVCTIFHHFSFDNRTRNLITQSFFPFLLCQMPTVKLFSKNRTNNPLK